VGYHQISAMTQVWLLAFVLTFAACAHDIPNDVKVQVFFRPEGNHLRLAVRVPMRAMRDQQFPENKNGYLELENIEPLLRDAATLWLVDSLQVEENDILLPRPTITQTRVALESDPSFSSWDTAVAHLQSPPLTQETRVVWDQTYLDVLLQYPIQSDRSRFSIHPAVARLGVQVVTTLRFLPAGGAERALEFSGDPGMIRLDPSWHQAAARFIELGFRHILDGTDHLLFLFCLAIPFRKLRALVPIVTSFTVAHSITLLASAYGLGPSALWFPPLIETLIAASILYMALENIVGSATVHRRWIIAFFFGLVHGFGFSFALRETLQFAGTHLVTSLLAFNVGVELGQLLVLLLLIPLLEVLFRFAVAERMATIILSAFAAHTAWHWMLDRWDHLRRFRFEWPEFTSQLLSGGLHWAMVLVAIGAALWFISSIVRKSERSL
jgi:hypothetical protein